MLVPFPGLAAKILPFRAATAMETGEVGPELGGEAKTGADAELVGPVVIVDEAEVGEGETKLVSLTIDSRLTVASFRGDTSRMSAFSSTITLRAESPSCLVRTKFRTFPGVPITTWAAMYGNGSCIVFPELPNP